MALKRRWQPERILVEDASSGTGLVQQLRSERHHEFRLIRPRGSKFERFIAQTDILQSDRVATCGDNVRIHSLRLDSQ